MLFNFVLFKIIENYKINLNDSPDITTVNNIKLIL